MEDAEWAFFEQLILSIRGQGGRRGSNHRLVLDGIFWIARTGAQWRDLPEEFSKWSSLYRQFRRWTLAELWDLVLEALNENKTVPDQVEMIDSTFIRAHHLSAGAKGGLKKKVLTVQKVASRPKFTSLPPLTDCLSGRK
jgi:transposase